ncbi:MAG: hypothetical protein OXH75_16385 [Acidobacteria bacterium]|nr:hypothetical protein [Acidobacteriota bacterium]
MWVILDTWSHYLKVHRVKDTAGPGEQGLLIGDVVDLAREYGTAVALAHHNRKNPSAAAESGDAAGEYRDPTAIGAAVDMIVSVSRSREPRARRLTPSGRWAEEPLTVVLEPGVGYELAAEPGRRRAGRPGSARAGPAPRRPRAAAPAPASGAPLAAEGRDTAGIRAAAERAAAELVAEAVQQRDGSATERSFNRTMIGVGMMAAGGVWAALAYNRYGGYCIGSCAGRYVEMGAGLGLIVTGALFTTIWSDVPARQGVEIDVSPGRVRAGKTFTF